MVVAIDGPAGCGKSTVAKILAERLHLTFLNSGSFYRGITLALLRAGIDLKDEQKVLDFARGLNLDYVNSHLILEGEDVEDLLHTDQVDAHAAQVSAIVPLRHIVNEKIREVTKSLSIVCEGRDMTTVVFPNAEHKFYLDASIDVQAQRRFDQGVSDLSLEEIKESIRKRDEIDKNKAEGALKIAPDALYIDTSHLTIEEVCEIMTRKIQN
ncbi:MAG: (d)CMP kinase [Candidatus Treponema excrementipullorum]|nr:(d)CMP kinase [Spirochaetia bacterium]MCI6953994.1 (d)CMP kinase [Spirochaetia bacterium]MCI7589089.1 (d)CMP kinase [Spirochaetia bacterium]MDD7012255.1 (d)CMP kinase [Candidatus Treponema excrementipullorum]